MKTVITVGNEVLEVEFVYDGVGRTSTFRVLKQAESLRHAGELFKGGGMTLMSYSYPEVQDDQNLLIRGESKKMDLKIVPGPDSIPKIMRFAEMIAKFTSESNASEVVKLRNSIEKAEMALAADRTRLNNLLTKKSVSPIKKKRKP